MKPKLILCLALVLSGGLFGCSTAHTDLSDLPIHYYNPQYDFTFSLPASWRGYSVLIQQWDSELEDESAKVGMQGGQIVLTRESGPMVVLRHPQWKTNDLYQDIPIEVFTRSQWKAYKREGKFLIGAGGFEEEVEHNAKYVFAISSRFNADDSVKEWHEANVIVEQNEAANQPTLYPEP